MIGLSDVTNPILRRLVSTHHLGATMNHRLLSLQKLQGFRGTLPGIWTRAGPALCLSITSSVFTVGGLLTQQLVPSVWVLSVAGHVT